MSDLNRRSFLHSAAIAAAGAGTGMAARAPGMGRWRPRFESPEIESNRSQNHLSG